MRVCAAVAFIASVSNSSAEQSASKLLNDLKSKRETLSGIHQEFESANTFTSTHGIQTSHEQIVLDVSGKKWRERSVSGAGSRIRMFDGNDLFAIEEEDGEYVRIKRKDKDKEKDPEPAPYGSFDLDWAKAKELGRQSCGFATVDHTCIAFEVPVRGWVRMGEGRHMTRMTGGVSRLAIDSENGLLIQSNTQEMIDDERGGYRLDRTFLLKGLRYGKAADSALFALPIGMREVKEFTEWNAGRIRKQLAGKPAPELEIIDIKGKPVSLSALKGKTVLLDFWTTWCPPCLADAPVLDDLYRKYADKNLMILGISVNEDRETVENFLQKHGHNFPVILTTENEMPRAYQIGEFPTYIVIDPNGAVNTAFDGDQGFGELRKHLAKAGMETH